MDNIQFTFKHNLNTNFLEIEGTKTFNNKNYVCSVYGKIDKIDLQEVLRKITISIQDKIIEDLSSEDNSSEITRVSSNKTISEMLRDLNQSVNKIQRSFDTLIDDIDKL